MEKVNNKNKTNIQERGVKWWVLFKEGFWNPDKDEGTQKEEISSSVKISAEEKKSLMSTLEDVDKNIMKPTSGEASKSFRKTHKLAKEDIKKVKKGPKIQGSHINYRDKKTNGKERVD